eukprot:c15962_g1_i1 orf=85-258(+)
MSELIEENSYILDTNGLLPALLDLLTYPQAKAINMRQGRWQLLSKKKSKSAAKSMAS